MQTRQRDKLRGPPPPAAGATTMTAIVQDRYGAAPEGLFRLAEIARPAIGDGEVLVRVHAASVDRGSWHIMPGLPYPIRLAGFAPGDDVYGMATSTFADYAAARPGKLAAKPAPLSFDQAAAIPISGGTALQAVR